MALHSEELAGSIHVSHNFSYADATARGAAVLAATDIGKIAVQLDDMSFWILQDDSPLTWASLTGAASGTIARTINAQTGTTYTFALTDGSGNGDNPLVTFDNVATQTVTVPANGSIAFPIGTQIDVIQLGSGEVVFAPDGGVTINSYNSSMTMLGQNTQVSLIKTATNTWELTGFLFSYIAATGGSIVTSGAYKIHTFTTSGTFTVTSGSGTVESLVIAGGGGAGGQDGSGGGAGGMLHTTPGAIFGVGSYTVTVGAGGTGGNGAANGTNGADSVFNILTATGGGGGRYYDGGAGGNGGSGGGGAAGDGTPELGGTGVGGQGFAGGAGSSAGISNYGGGGGGGAGGLGGDASSAPTGGTGGIGASNSITGAAVTYASGGGGGSNGGTAGSASAGGGGAGSSTGNGTNGTANLGGGGGGGGPGAFLGGNGGSGLVILKYRWQ